MAYDLRRLAPEKDVPPFKPAWKGWVMLFVLVVGGGAFCIISLWPGGASTQTPWFWVCVIAFPLLGWVIPFFIYLGLLQSRKQQALDYNEVRADYIHDIQREAGVPLHVLGSGFIFSALDHENTPLAITERQLVLEPRSRYPGDDESVMARWIEPPGDDWRSGASGVDTARHQEVLRFVMNSLVEQIAPTIRSLPERTRLVANLSVQAMLEPSAIERIWCDAWTAQPLPAIGAMVTQDTPPELIDVDRWLDGDPALAANAVTVLCAVQLNPLLNALPEPKAAEAGVVMVLAPSLLAVKKHLTTQAWIYRPEISTEPDLSQKVLQALLWSRTQGSELADHWLTGGAEAPLQRVLARQLSDQRVAVAKSAELQGQHDLDRRVGDAGPVAPWLAVSLASTYAQRCSRKQLVSVAKDDKATLVVIEPRP